MSSVEDGWNEIKMYFEEVDDGYGDMISILSLDEKKWNKLTINQQNLLKKYIMNANKYDYDFVPTFTNIYLGDNKNADPYSIINWITDILQFSSSYNEYEFCGDLHLYRNNFIDQHIEKFCYNMDNKISMDYKKENCLVYGYCKNIPNEIINVIFQFYLLKREDIECKLDVLRLGGNMLTYNGYKILLNTIKDRFKSLRMVVFNPNFDDKCCQLLCDFFLTKPNHKMDQIWLTENKQITEKGVMSIQNMIDENIKKCFWEKNASQLYHKTFFMNFCGLKKSEIEHKFNIQLDARIDIDDTYT